MISTSEFARKKIGTFINDQRKVTSAFSRHRFTRQRAEGQNVSSQLARASQQETMRTTKLFEKSSQNFQEFRQWDDSQRFARLLQWKWSKEPRFVNRTPSAGSIAEELLEGVAGGLF